MNEGFLKTPHMMFYHINNGHPVLEEGAHYLAPIRDVIWVAHKARYQAQGVGYQIASFMVMRNPTTWRWSHARHHTNTIIVGLDPEIGFMRPPRIVMAALNFIGIPFIFYDLRTLARHAFVGLNAGEKTDIPESERYKAVFWARLHIGVYAVTILLTIGLQTCLPLMLIGGPQIYGC